MKPVFYFLSLFCLFTFSCKPNKQNHVATSGEYFDLSALVREDINYNKAHECAEEKTVYLNGRHETRKLDTVNWDEELDILLNCDINLPAWSGKFKVDSTATTIANPGCMQYFYRSTDKKIPINSLTVNKDSLHRIINVIIQKQVKSILFSHRQSIEYIPRVGYSLRSEQKTNLFNSLSINVDIKYNCKN